MRIDTIDIEKLLLLALMENATDQPFRIVCKCLGANIVFTEFVNFEGLVRNSLKTKKKMEFREEERPFGIQIYGGEESSKEGAARIAERINSCTTRRLQSSNKRFTANQFNPENLHVFGRIDEA